jgi:K+-transporting ATPase KdpF subunit
MMLATSFDNVAGLALALAAIAYLIVVLIRPERF